MSDDTRDKVIALEVEVRGLKNEVHDLSNQFKEVRDILLQAKGARWVLLAMAGLGGFIAGTLPKIWPFLSGR